MSDSDIQGVLLRLTLIVENCRTALIDLRDGSDTAEGVNGEQSPIEFGTLRTDFLSILALLYAASTKVALALKPGASVHHRAAIVPLTDLSNNVAALLHSIRLMRRAQGSTLLAEYEGVARNVIGSIEYFVDGLRASIFQSDANDNYLVAVGKVHELIDNAKRPGALSPDNKAAVRKKWMQDHDSLLDGAEEIEEMCKPSEHEDNYDDGWENLGFRSKQDFSPDEKARIEMVKTLVKLANLLHRRVVKDQLSPNSPQLDNIGLDRFSSHSSRLLVASDNLISSMYAPQHPSIISSHLDEYMDVVKDFQETLLPRQGKELGEQLAALSISGQDTSKSTNWFATCFNQIDKAAAKISATVNENSQS